jgi:hypothetical protein
MKKEVGASGRITSPPTLELVAGGFLETGKYPPVCLQPFTDGLEKGLQREDRSRIRHVY